MGDFSLIADDVKAAQFTVPKFTSAVSNEENTLIKSVVRHEAGRGYYVTISGERINLVPGDYLVFRSGVLSEVVSSAAFAAVWELIASTSISASASASASNSKSASPSASASSSTSSSPSASKSNSPSSSPSPSASISSSPSSSKSASPSSSPSAS